VPCTAETTEFVRPRTETGKLRSMHYLGNMPSVRGLKTALLIDVLADTDQAKKGLRYYRDALAAGQKAFKYEESTGASTDGPSTEFVYWRKLRPVLRAKIEALDKRIFTEAYGLDYLLYKEAQDLRVAGKLTEAEERYQRLVTHSRNSVYGAAAGYYLGLCTRGEGRADRMIEYYTGFVKSDPDGLYRGEALYTIAELHLRVRSDPGKATTVFERAVEWSRAARKNEVAVKLYTMPEKSRQIAAPPPSNQKLDQWGIIRQVAVPPGKLLNRLTAKWYLDDLEKRSRYGLVFCLMATDRWDEAATVLEPIPDLDPYLRKAHEAKEPSTYMRYKLCCRHRRIVADGAELKTVPSRLRLEIMHADFLYLQRDFDVAQKAYEAVLAEAKDAGRKERESVQGAIPLALVSLGEIAHMRRDAAGAEKLYRDVIRRFPEHPSAARAAIYLANRLVSGGGATEERLTDALHLYDGARKVGRGTLYEHAGLAGSITVLDRLGRGDEARERAERLLARADDTHWRKFAEAKFRLLDLDAAFQYGRRIESGK